MAVEAQHCTMIVHRVTKVIRRDPVQCSQLQSCLPSSAANHPSCKNTMHCRRHRVQGNPSAEPTRTKGHHEAPDEQILLTAVSYRPWGYSGGVARGHGNKAAPLVAKTVVANAPSVEHPAFFAALFRRPVMGAAMSCISTNGRQLLSAANNNSPDTIREARLAPLCFLRLLGNHMGSACLLYT